MSDRNWGKYFAEGILIVFSVLLALFLNQLVENYKIGNQKEMVLSSIQKEIETNLKAVKYINEKHQRFKTNIQAIRSGENDRLKRVLRESDFFDLSIITNGEALIDQFISNTSWQTAQSIGIISEFDYDLVEQLTLVYALQDIVINQTLKSITETLFDRSTHDMDKLDETLIQFELRFNELTGQEALLIDLLTKALNNLNSRK